MIRICSINRKLCGFSRISQQNVNILNLDNPTKRDKQVKQLIIDDRSQSSQKRKKSIKWSAGSIGLLVVPAIAFSLGCWQVYRLQWKLDLIQELKSRLSNKAIDFPINDLSQLENLEYCRVKITGEFLYDREFTITPRGRFDEGFIQKGTGSLLSDNNSSSHGGHVITPFRLAESNVVIMVNRGWVPMGQLSRQSRIKSEQRGVISLEAIVRKSETRPQFVSQNIPDQGVWFYKDFEQMALQCGSLPIYVEAVHEYSPPGGPIGGQTNISIRNDHLSYLFTWYSLSAVTVAMWIAKFRK